MDREILFRGKRLDDGRWEEGYCFDDGLVDSKRMFVGDIVITDYAGSAADRWVIGLDFYEVDPSTVGQYTGLTDRNGKRIFEGDILRYTNGDGEQTLYHAYWDYHRWLVQSRELFQTDADDLDEGFCEDAEIIGNIHDNPELVENG